MSRKQAGVTLIVLTLKYKIYRKILNFHCQLYIIDINVKKRPIFFQKELLKKKSSEAWRDQNVEN